MMYNDEIVVRLRIVGSVQGVGFRWFTLNAAQRLGLKGWVRNAGDGSVEVLAGGPGEAVAALREELRRGPPAARVARIEETPAAHEELPAGFEISSR